MSKLLRKKNFLLLWSSQISSQMAINIMNYLVLIHIFESTGSSIASSFIWVAYGIPAVIIGPIAATAVDMLDKRKVLIISNITQAVIILVYALLYQDFLYLSYGVVLLYSVMDQFYVPAEAASLPVVAGKTELPRANGLFFISAQSSALVGFGMAGLIREAVGFSSAMIVGSIMLMFAFFATVILSPRGLSARHKTRRDIESIVNQFIENLKEGYEFIKGKTSILFPFLFLIWLQVTLAVLVVNLPAMGRDLIQTTPARAGPMVVGPAGIGALLGTLMAPRILKLGIRKKRLVDTALFVMAFMFLSFGAIAPLLGFWVQRLFLVVGFFAVGFSYVSALVPSVTYLQMQTPPKLMGRVFGNFWFIANTATLIPVMFSATITDIFGINLLIIGVGLLTFGVFLFSRYHVPSVLHEV